MPSPIHIVGGGLAGSEAAWQVVKRGVPVVLHEMRPVRQTEAHQTGLLAESEIAAFAAKQISPLRNVRGLVVGEVRPAFQLLPPD